MHDRNTNLRRAERHGVTTIKQRSPCPVCAGQRTATADQRRSSLCQTHADGTVGDELNGYCYAKANKDGELHGFGHRWSSSTPRHSVSHLPEADRQRIKVTIDLLHAFHQDFSSCFGLRDFLSMTPAELNESFLLIDTTLNTGVRLDASLKVFWRDFPWLRSAHKPRFDTALKALQGFHDDVIYTRVNYFGETA